MWSTLKCGQHEGMAFKTAEEALKYLYSDEVTHTLQEKGYSPTCFIYGSNLNTVKQEVSKVYDGIKAENKKIEDIQKQMLPANPYYWEDIDGCLHVHCAEISMNYFERNSGCIAMFSGWNTRVLSKPDVECVPSMKALSSLALLGSLAGK